MRGITFNGKHSYFDLGLTIANRNIGNPSKIKRTARVPYSNVEYDFSTLYGGQDYTERPLSYTFNLINKHQHTKEGLSALKIQILNWLMGPFKKTKLYDDAIPGYYFLAEVVNGPELNENEFDGTLTVEYTAYPFKISVHEEGNDIWDEFNFLLDYAQVTEFNVSGSKEITIINPGINSLSPKIVSTNKMEIIKEDVTFIVSSGESTSLDFIFYPGENKMIIKGNGTISFKFKKELI